MNHNLIIGIVIILIIIFIYKSSENFDASSESVQNIASIYADKNNLATFNNINVIGTFNLLPTGLIVAFNSATAPKGWTLCDGTNGTPDLRGRFILSAGQGADLTNRSLNDKGGAETHTLNVGEMPAHRHNIHTGSGHGCTPTGRVTRWDQCRDNGIVDQNIIQAAGGNAPHNNMPPFYVLTYIMKL